MTSGKLTTHVLDTAHGKPAAQMRLDLWRIEPSTATRTHLKTVYTNADGRTSDPLLTDGFTIGTYEIVFAVGDYFAALVPDLPEPAFLNLVPIQFSIHDATVHYHVPLLVSPWAYSTYRGS
jgi:5-hydroxyisourate hydrolase